MTLYVDSIYNAAYTWTDPNGTFIGNSSQITLTNTVSSQSGVYQVHVVSPGCVDTLVSIDVTINSNLMTSQSVNPASCSGSGSATITPNNGTGPYNWQWAHGPSGNSVSNLAAGTYYVTGSDVNGCSTIDTVIITSSGGGLAGSLSTAPVSCNGGADGSIQVALSSGSAPYTYVWSNNGPNASSQNNLPAGPYSITVGDTNGCSLVLTDSISEPSLLVVSAVVISNTPCSSCVGSASATVSGGTPPYSYTWANGSTVPTVSNLCSGIYGFTVTDSNGCLATTSVTIGGGNTNLSITAMQVVNISCNSACDGEVTVVPSGGTLPYSYLWSTGGSANPIQGLCAGTYTVTVTDANGCSIVQSIILTEPPALTSSIAATPIQCNGACDGSLTVSPTGGVPPYSFVWSNGQAGSSLPNQCAGSYTVTITDANGCTVVQSGNITEPPALAAGINTVAIQCNGACDGSLTVSVSGGTLPYTVDWSNGQTGNTAQNLCAGTYIATITDANGCTVVQTTTLIEPPAMTINLTTASILCNGGCDGSLALSISGGMLPYTILWSNGQAGNPGIQNLCAGVYSATITDANGCSVVESTTIIEPPAISASFATSPIQCNGGCDGSLTVSPIGGVPPYTVAWSNGQPGNIIQNLCAGNYSATITDDNGCIFVTGNQVISEPIIMNLVVNAQDLTCFGSNDGVASISVIGGTSPYSYLWSANANNQNGPQLSGLGAGSYTVTVTDINNCTAVSSISLNEPPPVVPYASSQNILCFESSTGLIFVDSVQGSGPFTYSIDGINYQTSNTFTGVVSGNYTVYVQDQNGCEGVTSATVTQASPPVLNLYVSSSSIQLGETVDLNVYVNSSDVVTYEWIPSEGLSCTDCADPSVTPLASSVYTVLVTDESGCVATTSIAVTVDASNQFWVPNIFTPNGDGVNDRITVFSDRGVSKVNTFRVYSRWGALVFEGTDFQPNDLTVGWDGGFKGKPMGDGVFVYLTEVVFIDGTTKFLKGDISLVR